MARFAKAGSPGHPAAEDEEWLPDEAAIDGDVLMKARSVATARGLDLG